MGSVVSAIVKVASVALAPATGGFSLSGFLISTAASFALSAVTRALSPKPKKNNFQSANIGGGVTQNVRQAITTHKIVYGQTRVGGPYIFVGSSGNNQYLHLVIALAAHEIEGIDEVWFNDYVIPSDWINPGGGVTTGRYADYALIKKYLGTDSQAADPDLIASVPEWTTAHQLKGIAYLYVRLLYDQDKYPSGIPNISAVVRGKKCYDPRTSTTVYTSNPALFLRDYLKSLEYGFGAVDAELNDASFISAANICDEYVSVNGDESQITSIDTATDIITLMEPRLRFVVGDRVQLNTTGTAPSGLSTGVDYYIIPYQFKDSVRVKLATSLANAMAGTAINITGTGTGTHKLIKFAEPRYHGAALLDTGTDTGENAKDILSAFGGKAIYAGGAWILKAAAYTAPTITLSESDFTGPITVQTKLTRRDRFNAIKGVYTSPINDFQPSDYPVLEDSAGATADGEVIYFDYDLPLTNRPYTAQRLAKVELKKARQEIVCRVRCNLKALQVQAGDTVMLSVERFGWTSKVFDVTGFKFITDEAEDGSPIIGIELTLRETAAAVYDWSASEESDIDPAPNTDLPDPFTVSAVTGLNLQSVAVATDAAPNTYKIVAAWDSHPDLYVLNGGNFEIQIKKSADSTWTSTAPVTGASITADLFQAELATEYDIRIRAINNLQVRSNWNTIMAFLVGSSAGVDSTEDWGSFTAGPDTTEDWGDFSSIDTTEDWGAFT